jgi:hypothetical protein
MEFFPGRRFEGVIPFLGVLLIATRLVVSVARWARVPVSLFTKGKRNRQISGAGSGVPRGGNQETEGQEPAGLKGCIVHKESASPTGTGW